MANKICDNDCEHCDWVTCPKMEEETETITVSKGCLKARTGRFVVYDVEYLKRHIEQEAAIYGNVSAIEALKKSSWVPITYRDMTEEEKNEFTVEGTKILNCPLPDDGAEVLITTEFGNVFMDVFHNEIGDCYFEDYDIEDARAWMPLPESYKKKKEAEA